MTLVHILMVSCPPDVGHPSVIARTDGHSDTMLRAEVVPGPPGWRAVNLQEASKHASAEIDQSNRVVATGS